jgi:serpin B
MKKRIVSALLFLSTLLSGCSNAAPATLTEDPPTTDNSSNGTLSNDAPSDESSSEADAPLTESKEATLVKENTSGNAPEAVYNLGATILDANIDNKNIMVSPVSIERAMAMALEGASGETYDQLYKALYGELSGDVVSNLSNLYKAYEDDEGESFMIANSLWANSDNNIELNPDYSKVLSEKFDAESESLPFSAPDSVDRINSWVSDKTHQQIPNIIQDLHSDHNVVIINSTYFKSAWFDEFEKGMDTYNFTNADGTVSKPLAMYTYDTDTYLKIKGYDAFQKGYRNGFYYVAILPDESKTPADVIRDLSYEDIVNATPERATLSLTFPSYESDYDVDLTGTLKSLGMEQAFSNEATFDKICNDNCKLSSVIHKTHIKLDEKGTEAAAVTAIIMATTTAMPQEKPVVELVFDRPFVYYIFNQNDVPVFMGVVNSVK